MAPLTPYRRTARSFNFNPLPSPTFTSSMTSAADESWTADEDMADAQEANYSRQILPQDLERFPGNESPVYHADVNIECEGFAEQLDRFVRSRDDGSEQLTPTDLVDSFLEMAHMTFEEDDKLMDQMAEISGRDPRQGGADEWEEEDFFVQMPSGQTFDYRDLWQHRESALLEIRTWMLFKMLPDALQLSANREKPESILLPNTPENAFMTNRDLFKFLKEHDSRIKHLSTVMRWLVEYAPEPEVLDSGFREGGWIYTKARIKNAKRVDPRSTKARNFLTSTSRWAMDRPSQLDSGVTELDPDAPIRQQRELEPEDREAEEHIMRSIFTFLRAKDLPGAVQLCRDVGEHWRGHTLIGSWETYDDEQIEDLAARYTVPGADRRELWRRTCYNLSHNESIGPYERAVYGLLAGDLQTVLPVCEGWEDHLFAHINSLIESYFAHFLQENGRLPPKVNSFEIYDFLQHHGHEVDHLPRIVEALKKVEVLQMQTRHPQRIIQGSLMSGRFYDHIIDLVRQAKALRENPEIDFSDDPEFKGIDIGEFNDVRLVVHILILNKFITGQFAPTQELIEQSEELMAAYIEFITVARKFELAPLYAGLLSAPKAIEVMGESLMEVSDEDQRRHLISLLNDHEIPVPNVLEVLVANVLEKSKSAYSNQLPPKNSGILGVKSTGVGDKSRIAEDDYKMIKAVEWMLLQPGMETAIAEAGCRILNRFFSTGRIAAAAEFLRIVPSRAIQLPVEERENMTDEQAIFASLYIEFEIFINNLHSIEEWKRAIRAYPPGSKSKPPRNEIEPIFAQIHTNVPPTIQTWLDKYTARNTSPTILSSVQLARQLYIPDLTLALHQVYMDAGRLLHKSHYTKVLELPVILADSRNGHALQAWKESGRLKEYVSELAEASKIILGASEVVSKAKGRQGAQKGWEAQLGIWNV